MRVKPALIIQILKRNELKVGVTARELGIHRTTIWRWKIKARKYIYAQLSSKVERKSTRPKTLHFALTAQEKDLAIALRKQKGAIAEKVKKKTLVVFTPLNYPQTF